ncbi:30S ribosomal protein S4 [Candidatus Nomurabacteria bacterium]|nr:30S ribosomal protein S4 [Candidatus Nomurabacteria bacterium]
MIIGPKFKIARRLGSRVFPKTQTSKFSLSSEMGRGGKKPGGRRPKALSEYGKQLLEKQKARYTYLLKESQFGSYVKKVRDHHQVGENPNVVLYQTLESRLDNVVFRLGLAPSRAAARQMVTHGHIVVNNRRLNIPSHQMKINDRVAVRMESRSGGVGRMVTVEGGGGEEKVTRSVPTWLAYDEVGKEGKVLGRPLVGETEGEINFGAIMEFYSRV